MKEQRNCKNCNKLFLRYSYKLIGVKNTFCSKKCKQDYYHDNHIQSNTGKTHFKKGRILNHKEIERLRKTKFFLGKHHTQETIDKISRNRTGKNLGSHNALGYHHTEEAKAKISQTHTRERNWRWIPNRSLLKEYGDSAERRSPKYKFWSRSVKMRDSWKCKMCDCKEGLITHHILGFTEYPELRYDINNGITLCHAHHPRKRAEEKRLSPYFKELVSVSKEKICLI